MREGDEEWVSALLASRADPDVVEPDGMGPLHVACLRNQLACLQLLLAAGADVELQTCDRMRARPLHVAAGNDRYGVGLPGVQALLEAGADPTAARADGQSSASLAPSGSRVHRTLLASLAAWAMHAPPPAELPSRAALVHAAAAGRCGRVLELLQRHTDPDSVDEHGAGALHVACARGDALVTRVLLAAGASANLPAQVPLAPRPLHLAADAGSVECVAALLEAAADPQLGDARHWLPLERCGARSAQAALAAAMLGGRGRTDEAAEAPPCELHVELCKDGPVVITPSTHIHLYATPTLVFSPQPLTLARCASCG